MGGAAGLDGAMRLHSRQDRRTEAMAGVIPGQKTEPSARAVIAVTPWWAEWRDANISDRKDGGIKLFVQNDAVRGVKVLAELEVFL